MSDAVLPSSDSEEPSDFIRDQVAADQAAGRTPQIHTRFPPEPNGYLHIGHAKSICLNFGIARQFGGVCNLRLDDTNPTREETEYVESIVEDVRWLISGWADARLGLKSPGRRPETDAAASDAHQPAVTGADAAGRPLEPFYASDYFEALYGFATQLIRKGRAYVCDLSPEETERLRGSPDRPGTDSPFRSRTVEENLDLFARMRAGEFPDAARTLRARLDMASPNIWLRDPVLYRIRHAAHHRTGDRWCLYPMYDFAHCLSDYIEGITHSICTLEFEVHRPLYDWILASLGLARPRPRQIEFARLNLGYTVMSKRKLLQLVTEGRVSGWNDPRMPTLSGLRRRGIPPSVVRDFVLRTGVTKVNAVSDLALLEHVLREQLNRTALRRLAVLRPLKLVLTNLAEGEVHEFDAVNNPEDPGAGTRKVRLGREVFIEQDDFQEVPPPKYFRLRPGGEVRLKYACIVRCDAVLKDASGRVTELHGTADLDSRTGGPNAGRKVKGTIHWVHAAESREVEVRLVDRLFTEADPEEGGRDFRQVLNPASLESVTARVEPALADPKPGIRYQFERLGYFWPDSQDSAPGRPVFLRTVSLKDAWARVAGTA
ncbi:MAG: glutamine--tRNA ligase [Verrucomicrobia bacterium]|nr:glutamine--tRNA ligase [Verrucomicrobiota bacterium]